MQCLSNALRSYCLTRALGLRYAAAFQAEGPIRLFSTKERITGLEDALRSMLEASSPTSNAKSQRQNLIAAIQNSILGLDKSRSFRVMPFGSYASSFYDQWSDLDLVMYDVQQPFEPMTKGSSGQRPDRRAVAKVLARTASLLERDGVAQRGGVSLLTRARVPIIKFRDRRSGISVDICMGTPAAAFKAWSVEQIGALQPSFGELLRLVKVWAKAHSINDAASNMFNSWCLTLMVVFYLQKHARPKLLPPIRMLLGDNPSEGGAPRRLMQDGEEPSREKVEAAMEAIRQNVEALKPACSNRRGGQLVQLFGDFVELYTRLLRALLNHQPPFHTRGIGISTYFGDYRRCRPFQVPYVIFVEDPYDSQDNTARSLRRPGFECAGALRRKAPSSSSKASSSSSKRVGTLNHIVAVFERTARRLGRDIDAPSPAFDAAVGHSPFSSAWGKESTNRPKRDAEPTPHRKKAAAAASATTARAAEAPHGATAGGDGVAAAGRSVAESMSPLPSATPSTATTHHAVASAASASPTPSSPSSPPLASTLLFLFGTELLTRLPDLSARLLGRELDGWARGALAAGRPEWEVHEGLLRRMGAADDFETFHAFLRRHRLRVFKGEKYQTPEERAEAAAMKAQQQSELAARREAKRRRKEEVAAEWRRRKGEQSAAAAAAAGSASSEPKPVGVDVNGTSEVDNGSCEKENEGANSRGQHGEDKPHARRHTARNGDRKARQARRTPRAKPRPRLEGGAPAGPRPPAEKGPT